MCLPRGTDWIFNYNTAVFTTEEDRFDPGPFRLRFVMGKVALGNVCLRLLQLSAVSFILPMVQTCLRLCVILIRRANGKSLEGFKKQCCLGNPGVLVKKVLSVFC